MSKHTPGPWRVGKPTQHLNQLSIEPAIGVVYGAGDEIHANARLVAAAPDMLEALERIASRAVPVKKEEHRIARAAIAKAKGEE